MQNTTHINNIPILNYIKSTKISWLVKDSRIIKYRLWIHASDKCLFSNITIYQTTHVNFRHLTEITNHIFIVTYHFMVNFFFIHKTFEKKNNSQYFYFYNAIALRQGIKSFAGNTNLISSIFY